MRNGSGEKSDRVVECRLDGRQSRRRTGPRRSQQIAVVKRTDEKGEPQTQSSCGSKRGGGNGSSHRREQSGSVGEGRLDGKGNSRRLAGHSTAVDKKF